jgi:hypothetical protein
MSDLILIVGRCLCQITKEKGAVMNRFHFKGYYLGNKVKEVHVRSEDAMQFIKGVDYLLWVKSESIQMGILNVQCLKSKKIS